MQLGNGDPGLLKTGEKRFFPPPPAACLPSLPPLAAAKPWHLLGSARSTWAVGDSGLEAQRSRAQFKSPHAGALLCDPGTVACLFWAACTERDGLWESEADWAALQ